MKRHLFSTFLFILLILGFFVFINTTQARSGCCSWHGGVCGCGCCDGTPLSSTCAPYYPECNNSYTYHSCPLMSSYDSISGQCKCYSGYVVGKDILGNDACISEDQNCQNIYGYNSRYNILTDLCECNYGYVISGGECINGNQYCHNLFGIMSSYDSLSKTCECDSGYTFNGSECVYNSSTNYSGYSYTPSSSSCPLNSTLSTDGNCHCNSGYVVNTAKDSCITLQCPQNSNISGSTCICNDGFVMKNGICITYTDDCINSFGPNTYGTKGDNTSTCYCNNGYVWNSTKTACTQQNLTTSTTNTNLYQRPNTTVVIPSVTNFNIGNYGKKIFTDRPDPIKIVGAMVKGETDPATYIVDSDGKLRWIKTEVVAKRLFGTTWDSNITWFNDSIIYTYQFGNVIEQ